MKRILCMTLLLSFPFAASYSASTKKAPQLPTQTIDVQPTHLTTRIEWTKFPKPKYSNEDLKGQDRSAVVRIYANEQGHIKQAAIQDSTGYQQLDQLLLNAVKSAEVRPHIENKTALPIIGYQVFNLKLTDQDQEFCEYSFNSKNWQAQQQQQKTKFQYLNQPELNVDTDLLNEHDRKVEFQIKANRKGEIKKVNIRKGSGIYQLDQQVTNALKGTQISTKRRASTLWLYKPSSFKDEIQFKLNECK